MNNQCDAARIDPITALATCGGDPQLLQKLVDTFHRTAPAHVSALCSAAEECDVPKLRQSAHKLRGLVSAFSPRIAACVATLEDAPVNQPRDGSVGQCARVSEQIAALTETLSQTSVEKLQQMIR